MNILLLLAGFTVLILGANWLVNGSSSLAKRLGVSDLAIGLTVVAFGTSMPELVVNIVASSNGLSDVVLGNVIGSNIFNLLLILGVSGMIMPIIVQKKTVWLEIPISLLAVVILFILANYLPMEKSFVIGRIKGIILLLFFSGFITYIFFSMKSEQNLTNNFGVKSLPLSTLFILGGLAGLIVGGTLVVNRSVEIATKLGMSEKLIGLTIISVGTSLPELATSVVAALKKNSDMAIGNVIGSNIFNIFLILGICAIIRPIEYPVALNTDLLILGSFTLVLFFAMFTLGKKKLDRWESLILLISFMAYMVFIINRN